MILLIAGFGFGFAAAMYLGWRVSLLEFHPDAVRVDDHWDACCFNTRETRVIGHRATRAEAYLIASRAANRLNAGEDA